MTWCWRHATLVAAGCLLLLVPALWLAVTGLSLDSDEAHMLSADLPHRQAASRFDAAFPQTVDLLVAVIDGDTPELAETSAQELVRRLSGDERFLSVERPPAELFFRRHALLFLPQDQVEDISDRLIQAQPLLGGLAQDPSARGLLTVLTLMAQGVKRGEVAAGDVAPAIEMVAATARSVLEGRPKPLSLQGLMGDRDHVDTRRVVLTRPKLDYSSLVPGEPAARAIRMAAEGLPAKVRLTGPVALSDDNFRTVAEGVAPTLLLSLALVTALLVVGVGSLRVTVAILLTLIAGLGFTSAYAAVAVGVLNPISVAFVVLFMGLAVDFCIQFSVRFRDEQYHAHDPFVAMRATGARVTRPLLVVAAAIALGFLSFLPTDYVGVSQLGLIAGGGMGIGVGLTLTLLPALLALLRPGPVRADPGFTTLAPLEVSLRRNAVAVLAAAVMLGVAAGVGLRWLSFDFDPLHLQDPKAESVATFRDLAADPSSSPYVVNVLTESQEAANAMAARLDGKPEIAFVLTLSRLIPEGQPEKLAMIADLDHVLGPSLNPPETLELPSDDEIAAALESTSRAWNAAGFTQPAAVLRQIVARGSAVTFAKMVRSGVAPLLEQVRGMLTPEPVTRESLPPDLVRDWVGVHGEGRVEVHPARRLSTPVEMKDFVVAVRAVASDVSGAPVAIVDSGTVVLQAFAQAGLGAVAAALVLLMVVLRRVGDALLVVAPLVLGAALGLALMAALGISVNFANIIAFPLLLGIGVAYNVYFVLNWRAGGGPMLPSSTARAVLFSALTTGVSFGALALSPHRGTASMGLVLMMALLSMVAASALVLPAAFALVGRRR
ncbi:MAG TPA: MMPL family transporter [Magnetospirillum sp.]|nr:MMPL family transporter [Magnetospirillum sp.]